MPEERKISTTVVLLLLIGAGLLLWWAGSGWQPGVPGGNQTAMMPTKEKIIRVEKQIITQTNVGSYPVAKVELKVVDKFDNSVPIVGANVDVLEDTGQDAEIIAQDPMHRIVDSAVTDANGVASLTSGWIMTGKSYVYFVYSDSIYAKAFKYTIPASSDELSMYPIGTVEVYRVGSFKPLSTTNVIEVNISGLSGLQYIEFDMTLGEAEVGKVVKDAVLKIETGRTVPMDGNAIRKITVEPTGNKNVLPDYIVNTDLSKYVDRAPIMLLGSIEDEGHVYMTRQDSATYTVTITYDADLVQAGNEIIFTIDDLGDVNNRDLDGGLKATAQTLTIRFVE